MPDRLVDPFEHGRNDAPSNKYRDKQKVKGGVRRRAIRRAKALGIDIAKQPTGLKARQVRRAYLKAGSPSLGGKHKPSRQHPRATPAQHKTPVLDSMTNLQYGGQQREIDSQRRISDQAAANSRGWYADYQRQVTAAAAQQQANTLAIQGQAYQQANTAAGTDQAANQQLLADQQAQAAQRGGTVDPALQATMQGGVAARQVQGGQFGGLLASQGQAQGAYLGNRVGVAAQQGIQAQQDEQRKRAQIDQLARDLQVEIGDFRTKTAYDLRQTRHKNRLEDMAFGLDVAQEQHDQADDRADNRRANRTERRQAAKDRLSNAKTMTELQRDRAADLADDGRANYSTDYSEYAQRTRPSKANGGSTGGPGGSQRSWTDVPPGEGGDNRRQFAGYVRDLRNGKDPGSQADPLLVKAAAQYLRDGHVSSNVATKIKRDYGFKPPGKKSSAKKNRHHGSTGVGTPNFF
jgi:hypothetical protein